MNSLSWIPYVLIGLAVGAAVGWMIASVRGRTSRERMLEDMRDRLDAAEGRAHTLEGTAGELRSRNEKLEDQVHQLQVRLADEREARARAEVRANEAFKRLEEEQKLLAEAEVRLTDTFKALAGTTLDHTTETFRRRAQETFARILEEAKGDLGKREQAISGLIKPLEVSLREFKDHVRELERNRQDAYSGLREQIRNLALEHRRLQKETGNLVTALRTPQVRGRWGEMALRRVAELSGMSEHCDFTEQVSVTSDTDRVRPDMVVHLPGGGAIIVDAKVSLDAYLNAISAETDEERSRYLDEHARQIRAHMSKLGEKAYWRRFEQTPDFVVMFIPGESFLAAAAHQDHALIEDGMKNKVVLATPTTFIALLRAVAYGWHQERIAESAQKVNALGRELYQRMATLAEHIADMGKGLEKANAAYNRAVGSLESRVLPAARRFRDLDAGTDKEIPVVAPVETAPRTPRLPDREKEEEE